MGIFTRTDILTDSDPAYVILTDYRSYLYFERKLYTVSLAKCLNVFYRNLAFGIGIQNFPEGLAVSLPLKAAGFSNWRSFW